MIGEHLELTPLCSIIIRAYNEEQHIGRLLTGIMQQSYSQFEIILVDSGSTDRTVEIAQQFPVKIVHINPEDFSFGFALNQGIANADGKFIIIASAHVYPVYPDWLERLIAPFEASNVALAYGKQRGADTTKYSEHRIFAKWFPDSSQPRQSHPFCNNANAAIRHALWEEHPYDESLSGLEDLAWATWAMENDYAISYVAEAEIIHVHNETPKGVKNRYYREGIAFKRIFPEEQFKLWDFIRLFTANTTNDFLHALRSKQIAKVWKSIFWFRWMQFWGTYQGYRQSGHLTWHLRQTFYYPGSSFTPSASRTVEPINYVDES